MPDEGIEVISYSGYREEEIPRSFISHNETIEIVEIIDRWIEEDFHNRTRRRFFRVRGDDGFIHSLYRDESSRKWFARRK